MRPKITILNPFKIQQYSRINLHIEQTNTERKSKNKTSLEGMIKSRMVQIIKHLMKTYTNKNTKQHKLNEYLPKLHVFSPDSKNLAPAPNKKKLIQPNFCPF